MSSNIIGIDAGRDMMSADIVCWFCQKALSPRALFCNHCGAIQPVRALDHFARLGLERRVDLEMETLDRQYAVMQRTLDPERFAIRTPTERTHAMKQMQALDEAYATLRDPVARGRYWLKLHHQEFDAEQATLPSVSAMYKACEQAGTAGDIDRVARNASLAFEEGIMRLMQDLRQQNWQSANMTLMELDGMETILSTARAKRQDLKS
jgi:molecular chaperone HscB